MNKWDIIEAVRLGKPIYEKVGNAWKERSPERVMTNLSLSWDQDFWGCYKVLEQ